MNDNEHRRLFRSLTPLGRIAWAEGEDKRELKRLRAEIQQLQAQNNNILEELEKLKALIKGDE